MGHDPVRSAAWICLDRFGGSAVSLSVRYAGVVATGDILPNEPPSGCCALLACSPGVIGHRTLEIRCHTEVGVIGLIGVQPPSGDGAGIRVLDALPAPPASQLTAAAVLCDCENRLPEVLGWFAEIRLVRPAFALMLVTPIERWDATLATAQFPVLRVIPPSELVGGVLPQYALAWFYHQDNMKCVNNSVWCN
jgi:hypothetical protein